MTWTGADHPGGAFQGGTVLAAMWILVIIAGLQKAPSIDQRSVRLLVVVGPAIFLGIGLVGFALADGFSQLSGGIRQAVDHCRRSRADPFDRRNARPGGAGYAATDATSMNAATLFGICGAALVGLGLFGLITNPEPLRKILAFNLLGTGTFLIFGVVARRGAAAGLGGDPVPQALVITGIVVAFSATAMAVVLLLRLFEESGRPRSVPTMPITPAKRSTTHDAGYCGFDRRDRGRISAAAGHHTARRRHPVVVCARRTLCRAHRPCFY